MLLRIIKLRGKEQVHSVLDDIKGIGPARRKSLMKYFKDIGKIKEASVEELCKADGITEKTAEEIYRFFHTATSKKMGMWYSRHTSVDTNIVKNRDVSRCCST